MSQQLLERIQLAYLQKDFIILYELFPLVVRRIKSLESKIELMTRSFDYNGEEFEAKEEG